MGMWKAQVWVTSAVTNETVPAARVLAESIRKTKTNYRIAVITSIATVSEENLVALNRSFDIVLLLEARNIPRKLIQGEHASVLAKTYVFHLNHFEKCVYVSPNSLFLENADNLFQPNEHKFQGLYNPETGKQDTALFVVVPDRKAWSSIWKHTGAKGREITSDWFGTWLNNQKGALNGGKLANDVLATFSVSHGKLLSEFTHAPIIHFVRNDREDSGFVLGVDAMLKLDKLPMGRREKLVADKWPEMLSEIGMAEPAELCDDILMFNEHSDMQECLRNDAIAIVGMSCRYPGANSLQEFWKLLFDGDEAIREPPAYRWTKEHTTRVSQEDRKSQAGFLSTTVDEFDARFFGVSPKEASYMDPQTRLLHEVLWESLEDAGIDPLSLHGSHTGIFTGSWMNDYKDIVASSAEKDFFRTYMGNSIGAAAARLSFLLGLTGPSIATESGCSSAIVALDLAVKSLRNGETNLALAGGVNLLLHAFNSNIMDFVISPNGRCKTFDASADGFGRAEGCGVLVLKRMSDALRDGDHIWALIRGSAISQEGLSRSLGTPTVHCESLAMKLALEDAHVSPERVSFVETHGTGTAVGDPMEVAAIAKAYYSRERKEPLVIGSVKTNVGHTESCSGITGIMKAVLAMQHELIPKHRNLETLNPEIFLESIPAIIPTEAIPWPKVSGQPRICGVSSFGITGTDGHVIIQESPDCLMPKFTLGMERPLHLIKISGKSNEALEELLTLYENQFSNILVNDNSPDLKFANAAYTANVGRSSFCHRAFLLGRSHGDAVKVLKDKKFLQGQVKDGHNPQICFLFTGQGSQYAGMAKTLYDTSPVFRINFDACDRTLKESYNLSIKQVLWESDPKSKELSRTIYSQTSIFCVEYCLLKLWESWGIRPDYVLGHSLGEFGAAVAAGVLTFEDALRLVAERSRLIDNLQRGSMLVIKASKTEVQSQMTLAAMDLDIAAVNNPDQTVVAGDTFKIEAFLAFLKGQGVKAIVLEATHAFHSRHMDPMLEKYRKVAAEIKYMPGNPAIQYVSGMEGRILDNSELGPDYWVRHTREKVSFINACAALKETGCQDFLEVGPQPILNSFVMMNNDGTALNCLPSLRRGTDDWETILTSLGKLYLLGYQVDWEGYDKPYVREKVSLPFHPFHRKSFWVECTNDNTTMIHPLIGYPMKNASAMNIFQNDLVVQTVPYLKDHCIGQRIVFPGAGFTEMCLSAGFTVANGLSETLETPTRAITLENVRIEAPLELKEGKACRLQVLVDLPETTQQQNADAKSGFRVRVYHQNINDKEESGKWVQHVVSTFLPVASTKECLSHWNPTRVSELLATGELFSSDNFYKQADEQGLRFGEKFRMIRKFWLKKQENCESEVDEVVAEMALPPDFNKYLLHPLIIDAIFQTGILTRHRYENARLKVPIRVGQLTRFPGLGTESLPESLYVHVWKGSEKSRLFVSTPSGQPIVYVEDVELLDTTVRTIESVLEQQSSPLPDAWEEVWKPLPGPFSTALETQVDVAPILARIQAIVTPAEDVRLYEQTKQLLCCYIIRALYQLGWNPQQGERITDIPSFCSKYNIRSEFEQLVHFYFSAMEQEAGICSWNPETATWAITKAAPNRENLEQQISGLESILKASKVALVTGIFERIAKNLTKILTGDESALALLFPQEADQQQYSAESYYQHHPGRVEARTTTLDIIKPICQQASLIAQQKSGTIYRVLEVGSGTGSLSKVMLETLTAEIGHAFEYYYTDISQSFFVKAAVKFEEHGRNIKYHVFNIESSPLSQGVPVGYFDLVVATDVLHATRNLEETLIHLRQTIRPGGLLFFTETIIAAIDVTFVFGLLEGYWRFQDFQRRPYHCCVDEHIWAEVLGRTGFRSAHCVPAYVGQMGCITAVAMEDLGIDSIPPPLSLQLQEGAGSKEWIIFSSSDLPDSWALTQGLVSMLKASGYRCVVLLNEKNGRVDTCSELGPGVTVKYVREDDGRIIGGIVGRDTVQGVIYGWGMSVSEREQTFIAQPLLLAAQALAAMVKPAQLFILTQGVAPVSEDVLNTNPSAATLFGMAKSLKNENPNTFVRYVDMDRGWKVSQAVSQVLYELASSRGTVEMQRVQVAYRGNVRFEPRLVKASLDKGKELMRLPSGTERYHLVLPASRMLQDLEFEPCLEETVREAEIEVKVKAYALNFKDVLTVIKPSAEFEKLNAVGLDFAGVVTKAGKDSLYHVGERVFGANFKDVQLPSHLVIEQKAVLRVPEGMTYWEASTMPAVFLTAYHCLINVAKMRKGDRVLIHTGSGGVGLAAIQLAKHVGATIITTAGNPRKRAYLRSLGIQHVFRSRDTSYEQDILRVTDGVGVDIVLNSITGPGIKEATLRATAKNGRWVEMSKLSTWTNEEVRSLRSDLFYEIVDLTTLDQDVCAQLLGSIYELLLKGTLRPIPYVKFDALGLRQAMQYFQKAKHIGKVVVTMPQVNLSQGHFSTSVNLFNRESTYLITGGLGGIGFEVCKWMLGLGAKNVVLVGRNPPKLEIEQQIKILQEQGHNIKVKLGDVGCLQHCKQILGEIKREGNPLRGVMHCAGVLRDNAFSNQTWESFEATFGPKVKGTWNLHELTLEHPLEYFLMFSSLTALLGTPGQPNHAGANCFEDAFIHYRHSLGLPGTTVNWGQWAQVGCAKDISVSGVLPVSMKRMLNGLEMTLRTPKLQICFNEFESVANASILCPLLKGYLDDRLWEKSSSSQSVQTVVNSDQFWTEMDDVESEQEKTAILVGYLKNIVKTALRLEADEPISEHDNLQELGVDSLMMIELKNSFQSLLGSRFALTTGLLKDCNTIQLLAEAVVGKLVDGDADEADIPVEPLENHELTAILAQDSILPEYITVSPELPTAVQPSSIETVLLTGATGHLGQALIAALGNSYPGVKKCVCLIRGEKRKTETGQRLVSQQLGVDAAPVEFVSGDVAQPDLGLSTDIYQRLCGSVDAIIHCAAKMHPTEHIRMTDKNGKKTDIRSVNLGGTLNVLKFACTGKVKHVYYPSTISMAAFSNKSQQVLSDAWPEKGEMDSFVINKLPGLQTCKYLAELLLEQANKIGIPCKVFRFPWIAGSSKTGNVKPDNMYILRFLSYLKLGAMPEVVIPANFLPVDVCAQLSLSLFLRDDTPNEIFNICHPKPQLEQEFVKVADEEFGKKLEILTEQEFQAKLHGIVEKELQSQLEEHKIISQYLSDAGRFVTGYLSSPDTFFSNAKLSAFICNYGADFSPTMEYLRSDLRFLKSTGLLAKMGVA